MLELDQDILDWISERSESKPLQAQIVGAKVIKRDYMRTGYFIYFEVVGDAAPVEKSGPLKSPDIMSPELPFGAGTTLFLRDGRLQSRVLPSARQRLRLRSEDFLFWQHNQ